MSRAGYIEIRGSTTPGSSSGGGSNAAGWPAGGSLGQIPMKKSGLDGDARWASPGDVLPFSRFRQIEMRMPGAFAQKVTPCALSDVGAAYCLWTCETSRVLRIWTRCVSEDSGEEQPTIQLVKNGIPVGPVITPIMDAWNQAEITEEELRIIEGDDLEVAVLSTGTNGDATDLMVVLTCYIDLPKPMPLENVSLIPNTLSIQAGSMNVVCVLFDPINASDRSGVFKLDNTSLFADVKTLTDDLGRVIGCELTAGERTGTATLTFTSGDGGKVASSTISVVPAGETIPLTGARFAVERISVSMGDYVTVPIIFDPPNATDRSGELKEVTD